MFVRSLLFTVRFTRSVGFVCGAYGALRRCFIPYLFNKSWNTLLMYCLPLSVIIVFGQPKRANTCVHNAFTSAGAVAAGNGTNSVFLVNLSWNTKSMVLPF